MNIDSIKAFLSNPFRKSPTVVEEKPDQAFIKEICDDATLGRMESLADGTHLSRTPGAGQGRLGGLMISSEALLGPGASLKIESDSRASFESEGEPRQILPLTLDQGSGVASLELPGFAAQLSFQLTPDAKLLVERSSERDWAEDRVGFIADPSNRTGELPVLSVYVSTVASPEEYGTMLNLHRGLTPKLSLDREHFEDRGDGVVRTEKVSCWRQGENFGYTSEFSRFDPAGITTLHPSPAPRTFLATAKSDVIAAF